MTHPTATETDCRYCGEPIELNDMRNRWIRKGGNVRLDAVACESNPAPRGDKRHEPAEAPAT